MTTAPPREPQDRPLRLLVDARALHASGLGRYLRSILTRLLEDPRFGPFVLLGDVEEIRAFGASVDAMERVEPVEYPCVHYSPRTQAAWQLLRLRSRCRADVYFFPHYDVPIVALPPRSVVTVHDLIHFAVPEVYSGWRRRMAGLLLDRGLDQASLVLTVSEATRRDLVARRPGVAGKVVVIPNGVDSFFHRGGAGEGPAVLRGAPFVLCVGNRKPHKNLVAGVEVLARLRATHPALKLAIAGPRYTDRDPVSERARELGVSDRVIDVGTVSDEELRWLYANCAVLLFPSLYEGFGLPALEAMACGAPVVCSDRASLPEVVGGAGWQVAPNDYEGMAEAVRTLMTDEGERRRRVEQGLIQSAGFTWDRAAARVADELVRVAMGREGTTESTDRAAAKTAMAATMTE